MEKTVIFLGAGASKADGAPLQRELFKSYFQACADEELNWKYDIKNSVVKELVDKYFRNFYDFDQTFDYRKVDFPTFEEALGILDLAIERNEKYRSELGNLYKYRMALIFCMAQAIQFRIDTTKSSIDGESHIRLVEKLHKDIEKKRITFISTNYDVILDDVLRSQFDKVDYGFYPMENSKARKDGVRLLKIHGSLNWKYCPVCKHIEAATEMATLSIIDNPGAVKCTHCSAEAEYIIIPPTYYKDMRNVYLANIWNNAEKALREAEHIVFSGYSLPSADMHIKYLLKRAELNREKSSRFKATIINYYPDKIEGAIQKEYNRYHRFFKSSSDINYIAEMSFQDFADNPYQILDK